MKIVFGAMALLAVIYFMSAFTQQTKHVDGSSQRAAFNSVKKLKRYMTTQEQHAFETAFWVLGEIKSKEGPDAFLPFVDGKSPEEIVELARQEVSVKIASGDPDFKKYHSWEDLIKVRNDSGKAGGESNQPLRNSVRTGRESASPPAPAPAAQPAQ